MAQPLAVQLLPMGTVTADGTGAPVDLGVYRTAMRFAARVTAFTPEANENAAKLDLTLQTGPAIDGQWQDVDTLQIKVGGTFDLVVAGLQRYVRVAWDLDKVASITFEVTGVAHMTYCDPADILDVVPEHSIEEIALGARVDACIKATDLADGYVGAAYELPLTAWGADLRLQTARLAAWQLFEGRGVDPGGPDKVVMDARDNAEEWLDRLANGRLSPPGIIDSTPEEFDGGSFVVSSGPPRGW